MQAKETRLQEIIEGTKQYVIPLFQRSYSWTSKEWGVLWNDIIELSEMDKPRAHFMGSVVNMPTTSVPHGVAKYLLIDGQQRLTTIFILLAVIRNKARETGMTKLADEIHNTLLVNQYKDGNDYYKLLPTQTDRKAYTGVIGEGCKSDGPITDAFQFFDKKLRSTPVELDKILKVIRDSVSVVSIVLDADDNPYLVFESLNAKGRRLTPADLIKNYFFMRIHQDQQDEVYSKYWFPMQEELGEDLPEFIRHYMMRNGGTVKVTEVYYKLKVQVTEENALSYIEDLRKFGTFYRNIIHPERESNFALRECFERLNRIEATTAYPILLYFYGEYNDGNINVDEFISVLKSLENYLIRRFICDYKTNQLNKIFPSAHAAIQAYKIGSSVDAFKSFLSERGYPRDNEFKTKFKETNLYGGGDRKPKTKFILESLEKGYHHKESINTDNLTIEHIMPQTLSEWWQNYLGEDWQDVHQELLNTIGNLTLTAYNPELSNDDFDTKKEIFAKSHLDLNKYLAEQPCWKKEQIIQRAELLAEQALEIWPSFGEGDPSNIQDVNITGSTPYSLEILGQEFSVKSWRDVIEITLNTLYELGPERFDKIVELLPNYISKDKNKFRAIRELKNGYFIEVNLQAQTIYRNCIEALKIIGLTKEDWIVKLLSNPDTNEHVGKETYLSFLPEIEPKDEWQEYYESKVEAPSKFSLNGGPFMKANKFVWTVIKTYMEQNPETAYKELERIFPDPKKSGSYGTIRTLDFVTKRNYDGHRYFKDKDEILMSGDNIPFVVSTQWSWHNAPAFAKYVRTLGFDVKVMNDRKKGEE